MRVELRVARLVDALRAVVVDRARLRALAAFPRRAAAENSPSLWRLRNALSRALVLADAAMCQRT